MSAYLPGGGVTPKVAKGILEPIINLIQGQLLVGGLNDCLEERVGLLETGAGRLGRVSMGDLLLV